MPRHPDPRLGRREQALDLLRQGLSRRDVASELGVSPQWVAQTMHVDAAFKAAVQAIAAEQAIARKADLERDIERARAMRRSGLCYTDIDAEMGVAGWSRWHQVDEPMGLTALEGRVVAAFEAGADTCGDVARATGIPYRTVLHGTRSLLGRGVLVDTGRTVLVRGKPARILRPA